MVICMLSTTRQRVMLKESHVCALFVVTRPRILCNVLLAIMILVFCSAFLILSRVRPLTDIYADMSRVLASDKELMFDLHVKARNPNWWTVQIDEADISVFAFSQLVLPPTSNDTVTEGKFETKPQE